MKIIIGLGNPEEKYFETRHNVGFAFLDKLQKDLNFPEFSLENKFKAAISKDKEIILAKPQTFMNLSGDAVKAILDFYKLTPADIVVIHDDLDVRIGDYKVATDSRSAGHNGVQNIIDNLGTQEFTRIRIGVGQDQDGVLACRLDAHDFVLGKFSKEELEKIKSIEENILEEIRNLL